MSIRIAPPRRRHREANAKVVTLHTSLSVNEPASMQAQSTAARLEPKVLTRLSGSPPDPAGPSAGGHTRTGVGGAPGPTSPSPAPSVRVRLSGDRQVVGRNRNLVPACTCGTQPGEATAGQEPSGRGRPLMWLPPTQGLTRDGDRGAGGPGRARVIRPWPGGSGRLSVNLVNGADPRVHLELEAKLEAPQDFRLPDLSDLAPAGTVVTALPLRELDATYYDTTTPSPSLGGGPTIPVPGPPHSGSGRGGFVVLSRLIVRRLAGEALEAKVGFGSDEVRVCASDRRFLTFGPGTPRMPDPG
jgi:hypothetical protein